MNDYITRTCPVCNKEYQADLGRLRHGRQTTCSRKCSYKLRGSKSENSINIVCPVCGKDFQRPPSRIERVTHQSFCSSECHYKGRGIGLSGRVVNKPYDIKRVIRVRHCDQCNSEYSQRKTTQKYCCRKCFELSHSKTMLGENNPSYIDGRSKQRRGYRGDNWGKIRKSVYLRDNYTCGDCGVKCVSKKMANSNHDLSGKIIQCHHIVPYRVSKDNSMENLITLCLTCHSKIHLNPSKRDG